MLNWDNNTIIRLQLWDIAGLSPCAGKDLKNIFLMKYFWSLGQERFGNMTRVYYKEAVGAFIVFDVTRSATFDAVVKWKQVFFDPQNYFLHFESISMHFLHLLLGFRFESAITEWKSYSLYFISE